MWIDKYLQLYIKNCPHYIWIFDFTNYIVENSQFYQSWNKCSGTSWKIWICRLKQEESCQVGDNSYLDIHGVLASASGTTQICNIIYLYISILKHWVILVNCNSSATKPLIKIQAASQGRNLQFYDKATRGDWSSLWENVSNIRWFKLCKFAQNWVDFLCQCRTIVFFSLLV